jgi:hypothetical protein
VESKHLIEQVYSTGLQKFLEGEKTRHEFQVIHGFGKFYKTHCGLAGKQSFIIEVTMVIRWMEPAISYLHPRKRKF